MSEHKQYPLQTVLELACAAQRHNKDYIKSWEEIYSADGSVMAYRHPNKEIMRYTLGAADWDPKQDPIFKPPLVSTNLADRDLANDIKKFYRRLMFNAVAGDSEFHTEVNTLLNSETIPDNKFGFIACLPSVYNRDVAKKTLEKIIDSLDTGWLGVPGEMLEDLDCEVIDVRRSKNYDAWNVLAIIDNKMASWMSKTEFTPGPCVVVRARIKDQGKNWGNHHDETRLNYVKAAQ